MNTRNFEEADSRVAHVSKLEIWSHGLALESFSLVSESHRAHLAAAALGSQWVNLMRFTPNHHTATRLDIDPSPC